MKNATNSTSSHTAIVGRSADGCSSRSSSATGRSSNGHNYILRWKRPWETVAGPLFYTSIVLLNTVPTYNWSSQSLRSRHTASSTKHDGDNNNNNNNNNNKYYDLYCIFYAEHRRRINRYRKGYRSSCASGPRSVTRTVITAIILMQY